MRGHEDAWVAPEQMIWRQRLLAKYIEGSSRKLAAFERRDQILLDQVRATTGVD